MMAAMTTRTKALHRDGANRGLRTFLQGLAIAVGTAVVPILHAAITGEGGIGAVDWTVTGTAAATAAGAAVLAYLWRVVLDPSGVRSLEPGADVVESELRAELVARNRELAELDDEPDDDVVQGHPAAGGGR